MFDEIKNLQVFPNGEMSNEDYRAHEAVSGSDLVSIWSTCPAQYRYGEKQESKALLFGTASHTCLLEPEKFDSMYYCAPSKEGDDVITSDAAMKAELKSLGIPVKSTAKFEELSELYQQSGMTKRYLKLEMLLAEQKAESEGKEIIQHSDFETVRQMREVIHGNEMYAELLRDAYVETSIIAEVRVDDRWFNVKIRPDIITHDFSVPDYKTVADMRRFPLQAHDSGYWLKMAFQHDVLKAAYPDSGYPRMGFFAQDKKSPYIPQLFWMTGKEIEVGREQYIGALIMHKTCSDSDCWPAYYDEAVDLPTPEWLEKRYNF